jgi:hypothetical protein
VIPQAASGKKGGGQGNQPVDYMKGGSLSPPYSPGQPAGNKPVSIAGTGSTPPTYAAGSGVPDRNLTGDFARGARSGLGNTSGMPPTKAAGQVPPSGKTKRPAARTGPNDKSKDVGVE